MAFDLLFDVAIGLVFVFALVSILCSALNEIVSATFNRRGRLLEQAIYQMLDGSAPKRNPIAYLLSRNAAITGLKRSDETVAGDAFFEDPLIRLVYSKGRLPSFLEADLASEVVARIPEHNEKFAKTLAGNEAKPQPNDVKNGIFEAYSFAGDMSREDRKKRAAQIYQYQMDRVSGWYKRRTQISLFFIGSILAFILNVDTINIASKLAENSNLRDRVAIAAQAYEVSNGDATGSEGLETARQDFDQAYAKLVELCLPIGRGQGMCGASEALEEKRKAAEAEEKIDEACEKAKPSSDFKKKILDGTYEPPAECKNPAEKATSTDSKNNKNKSEIIPSALSIPGWLLTGLAASLGAPFWFELLGKLINMRSVGVKPNTEATRSASTSPAASPREEKAREEFGENPPRVIPTLSAYEENLTNDDYTDIGLRLGVSNPNGRLVLNDPAFRAAVKRKKEDLGMENSENITPELVNILFKA